MVKTVHGPSNLLDTQIQYLPLLTGLLPIIAVHATWLVSTAQGQIPWCFPYLDSCVSISATGRHGAAFYLFKATMVPAAVLLALYWWVAARWLRLLGDARLQANIILSLGVIAAAFLIVYAVALGAAGDFLRLQRRLGIIMYFGFTGLSQLLLVWRLTKLAVEDASCRWLLRLCALMLSIGLAGLALDLVLDNYDKYENAFEWVLALLMHIYFLVTWRGWANTGLQLQLSLGEGSERDGKRECEVEHE